MICVVFCGNEVKIKIGIGVKEKENPTQSPKTPRRLTHVSPIDWNHEEIDRISLACIF